MCGLWYLDCDDVKLAHGCDVSEEHTACIFGVETACFILRVTSALKMGVICSFKMLVTT